MPLSRCTLWETYKKFNSSRSKSNGVAFKLTRPIAGSAITTAGEKVGDKLIPNERPMDKRQTARRLKGDMAELYKLYARLNKYADQAEETCKDVCDTAIGKVAQNVPALEKSPVRDDALTLCRNLLIYEGYFPLLEIDFTRQLPLGEIWAYTEAIQRQLELYQNPKRKQEIIDLLALYVQAFLPQLAAHESYLGYAQFVDLHHAPAAYN